MRSMCIEVPHTAIAQTWSSLLPGSLTQTCFWEQLPSHWTHHAEMHTPPCHLETCSSSSHSSPHHPFTVPLSLNRGAVFRSPSRTEFRPLVKHQPSRFPFPHGLFSGAPMASANLEQKDVGSPVLNDSSKNCVCVVF